MDTIGIFSLLVISFNFISEDISCTFALPGLCGWYNDPFLSLQWKRYIGGDLCGKCRLIIYS